MKQIKLVAASVAIANFYLVCPGFVRGYSLAHDFYISYLCYFLTVAYLCSRFPLYKKPIVTSFVLSVSLVVLLSAVGTHGALVGLPNLIANIIACILGYFFTVSRQWTKYVIVSLSVAICIYYPVYGVKQYFGYIGYGTSNGAVVAETGSTK